MSIKTILGILLAIAIAVFVVISLNWKKKETETQFKYTKSSTIKTDVIDTQTNRMMNANAQTSGLMAEGEPAQGVSSVSQSQAATQSEPVAEIVYINKGKYFGCTLKKTLQKLLKYTEKGDTKKFNALLNDGLDTGECIYFRSGEGVYLQETDSESGEVRVSRLTDSKSFWTVYQAIE